MSVWDQYDTRIERIGETKREVACRREIREITNKIKDSLSYFTVMIDDEQQDVAIVSSKNMNEKRIMSLPGESITPGGLVYWMNNYWLITEKDADSTVYEKATMTQCNHILKWIDNDGIIHEQWCVISDGTKYMSGEFEDRQIIITRPDSRIVLTIARNKDTVKFNRLNRFLIDDSDSPLKLSYQLTKPVKFGGVYNNQGVFKFVLQEVNSTADDNHELGIADYYKYFADDDIDDGDGADDELDDESDIYDDLIEDPIEETEELEEIQNDWKKKGWI